MTPESPRFPGPEASKDQKDKDGKPKKKSYRFLPTVGTEGGAGARKESDQSTRPRSLEDIITESRQRKAEKTEPQPEAPASERQNDSVETDQAISDEAAKTNAEAQAAGTHTREAAADTQKPIKAEADNEAQTESPDDHEAEEPIKWRELTRQELSGGETIRIRDAETLEGEVPLHEATTEQSEPVSEIVEPQPTFNRQSERQRPPVESLTAQEQTTDIRVAPPTVDGSGGGNIPPGYTPEAGTGDAEPPERPGVIPDTAMTQQAYETATVLPPVESSSNVSATNERPATRQEVEDALHRSAVVHEQRGLLSGLFVGVYFANRRLRRRQKQETKQLTRQSRQLNRQATEQTVLRRAQENQAAKTERRISSVENRLDKAASAEKVDVKPETKPKRTAATEAGSNAERPVEIPADHRLERSAWHTIEVDKKTGKAVETPSFQYGQEYYREKAHEHLPDDPRGQLAGTTAVRAVADPPKTDDSSINNHSDQAKSPRDRAQAVIRSASEKFRQVVEDSQTNSGPIWPWAVALVVIVLVLGLLIH